VIRVETAAPDLLDWGTHCFDLCGLYADDCPAAWVIGQVNEALALWAYDNGVYGLASTGDGAGAFPSTVFHRIVGTEGIIEVDPDDGPRLRRHDRTAWTDLEFDEVNGHARAIGDALGGLASGATPEAGVTNALNATELVFGIWESARRRGRVDLPLAIEDNPLEAMIEAGDLPVRDAGN